MAYHSSDKEEWDELMSESKEARRHHYDEVDVAIDVAVPDSWFWDDDREGVARRDMMMKSEADMVMSRGRGRRKPSNGWDW